MRVRAIIGAAFAAVSVAGCGGGAAAGPPPTALAIECGGTRGVHAAPLWLKASDGERVYALEGGTGDVGVVLAPESPPGDLCGWLSYIRTLEQARLRLLAFDFRDHGKAYDRDYAAAIARLRDDGAKRVVVVGASLGGARAMLYGSTLDADAIVSLSGEATLPEFTIDTRRAVEKLRVPFLIVGSRSDSYLPVPAARDLLRRAGSKTKKLVLFPGSWHGWKIVENAPYAATARAAILRWVLSAR